MSYYIGIIHNNGFAVSGHLFGCLGFLVQWTCLPQVVVIWAFLAFTIFQFSKFFMSFKSFQFYRFLRFVATFVEIFVLLAFPYSFLPRFCQSYARLVHSTEYCIGF
jgi:hypothetical protein